MERHVLEAGIDLELTMTSGQTFNWNRVEGDFFEGGKEKFYTFKKDEPLIVEQKDGEIIAETPLSREEVEKTLGIRKDLDEIFETFPEDERLEKARREFSGLRVLEDEFFPTLVGYLLSPQNRIQRIKKLHDEIAERWGETVQFNGYTLRKFPSPEQLEATEEELREIGTGYRAPYVVESTQKVREGFGPEKVRSMEYEEAREEMKTLHGVGDKVADCVLLFSLGFLEAAPLDTWAKKVVEQFYPEIHASGYEETSRNFRKRFGNYSGYAQEYLFHAARNEVLEVD